MSKHKIGDIGDFPEGKGTKVDYKGIEIAVFNLNGELYGIQNTCPHKNLPLHLAGWEKIQAKDFSPGNNLPSDASECACGKEGAKQDYRSRGMIDRESKKIRCPWHLLSFDLTTGKNDILDVGIATYDVEVQDNSVYLDI